MKKSNLRVILFVSKGHEEGVYEEIPCPCYFLVGIKDYRTMGVSRGGSKRRTIFFPQQEIRTRPGEGTAGLKKKKKTARFR